MVKKYNFIISLWGVLSYTHLQRVALLAQSVARVTLNHKVRGSSPLQGCLFSYILPMDNFFIVWSRLLGNASEKSSFICNSLPGTTLKASFVAEETKSSFVRKNRDIPRQSAESNCCTDSKRVVDWVKQDFWKGDRCHSNQIRAYKTVVTAGKIRPKED